MKKLIILALLLTMTACEQKKYRIQVIHRGRNIYYRPQIKERTGLFGKSWFNMLGYEHNRSKQTALLLIKELEHEDSLNKAINGKTYIYLK